MVSDDLAQAITAIRQQLTAKAYEEPKVRSEIERVVAEMDFLRAKLDRPDTDWSKEGGVMPPWPGVLEKISTDTAAHREQMGHVVELLERLDHNYVTLKDGVIRLMQILETMLSAITKEGTRC